MEMASESSRLRTRLPHVLATLYGLAIVYVEPPAVPSMAPTATGDAVLPVRPGPPRWIRYDHATNSFAYAPFGFFVAWSRAGRPAAARLRRSAIGVALSLVMESLQMYLPQRAASVSTSRQRRRGPLPAALAVLAFLRWHAHDTPSSMRARMVPAGALGDLGLALVAVWLVVQVNPGIPLFATMFETGAQDSCRSRPHAPGRPTSPPSWSRPATAHSSSSGSPCSSRCWCATAVTSAP